MREEQQRVLCFKLAEFVCLLLCLWLKLNESDDEIWGNLFCELTAAGGFCEAKVDINVWKVVISIIGTMSLLT